MSYTIYYCALLIINYVNQSSQYSYNLLSGHSQPTPHIPLFFEKFSFSHLCALSYHISPRKTQFSFYNSFLPLMPNPKLNVQTKGRSGAFSQETSCLQFSQAEGRYKALLVKGSQRYPLELRSQLKARLSNLLQGTLLDSD